MSPGEPCILCENLVKIHKVADVEAVALQGLDLTVARGELMAIIGPSGSGKSSLLNVLGGLDTPSAGRASVEGIDLVRLSPAKRLLYRRRTVGFVWQNIGRNLVPYLSALENVEMPMILAGTFDRRRALRLLAMVGLERRIRHTPGRMSGGEQQRVAIAIALANEPPVLLADEPTGSLDSQNADRVLEVFDRVRRELGVTVVIVTHDQSLARKVDRYVSIHDGRTSQEAVRLPALGAVRLPLGAAVSCAAGHGSAAPGADPGGALVAVEARATATESHEYYLLLDSAGRLRLPHEIIDRMGIRRRVKLVEEEGRIVILPPETKE